MEIENKQQAISIIAVNVIIIQYKHREQEF